MKTIRITLLVLIIIGIGLLLTQGLWVNRLVNFILRNDNQTNVAFVIPQKLSTKYISVVDWPPKVQILDQPFTCSEGGSQIAQAGQTEKQTINDRDYCVTKESEGAAGSVYVTYAYAFDAAGSTGSPRGNKTAILTFSLRFVQCDNYDEPSKTECQKERAHFNPDILIDQIARTVKN